MVYYTEYPENANPVTKVRVNGKNIESHSKTDSFGRKVFDEIQLGTGFVSRQFSYHAGKVTEEHKQNDKLKSSPTTQLVSQIVLSNGTTLSYAYDAEEHITSVTETYEVDGVPVVKVTSYTYDALGQLKTETKDGITTKFEYDNYGNILAKGVVDETGEIAESTKITYEYGNENWKDLLTSYNGQAIVYDEQGNPTEYLGHNLTWEKGRQLKRFVKDDGTVIDYTYNANGIRTSKTVDGIRHDFVLEGAKILKETWNDNTLVPLYDNSDSVCGIEYNGIAYFFFKNLQGDIIAITNGDGETVARYSYDAWGKCTVDFDTTGHIADINPFRYRGYYFDQDINLYYLNSRYYDANTGRFINADSPEYVSIQGGNLFEYCGNCPTKNADYFGFCYTPTYPESYVPSYAGSNIVSNSKFHINDYTSKSWLARLFKIFGFESEKAIGKKKYLIDTSPIRIYIQPMATVSSNGNAIISLLKDGFSYRNTGAAFKNGGIAVFSSLSILSTTVQSTIGVNKTSLFFQMSIVHDFTQNNKKVSLGFEFTFEVSLWLVALVAGIIAVGCIVPALSPVFVPIATTIGKMLANAKAVITPFTTVMATALYGLSNSGVGKLAFGF